MIPHLPTSENPFDLSISAEQLIFHILANWITDNLCFEIFSQMTHILNFIWAKALQVLAIPLMSVEIWNDFLSQTGWIKSILFSQIIFQLT